MSVTTPENGDKMEGTQNICTVSRSNKHGSETNALGLVQIKMSADGIGRAGPEKNEAKKGL